MLKSVESIVMGDVVSFRGSGSVTYRVRGVERRGQDVRLSLRSSAGHDVDATYKAGELARVVRT